MPVTPRRIETAWRGRARRDGAGARRGSAQAQSAAADDGRARPHHQPRLLGRHRRLAAAARPGWDYARARKAGVNCVIDNIGTYGYWNYNYSPKQALRLIETAHRFAEKHSDKMAIALTVADARAIVASGRMAVFLGCESGIDHEGDLDVLGAMLPPRPALASSSPRSPATTRSPTARSPPMQGGQQPDHYKGINERGRALVARDEPARHPDRHYARHRGGADAADRGEPRAGGREPRNASARSSGVGLSDEVLKALAAKGGLVGIHGGAARDRQALSQVDGREAGEGAACRRKVLLAWSATSPRSPRPPGDRGEYIARFDEEFRQRWRALGDWKEMPEAEPLCRPRTNGPSRSTT